MRSRKQTAVRLLAIFALFCMTFTSIPMLGNGLTAEAKSKKLPKKTTVSAAATGYHSVYVSWSKVSKPQSGYALFRDGAAIAHFGKKTTSFSDSGLAAGSYHSYQVKTYTKKTTKKKMWMNKYTGELRKKRPKKGKKDWKKKTIKDVKFKYKSVTKSPAGVWTASMPAATQQTPVNTKPTPTPTPTPTPDPTPTPKERTEYTCTNYLGKTRTFWKDENGKIYYDKTGGSEVSKLYKHDKTVDGEWTIETDNGVIQNLYQKNSVTIVYSSKGTQLNIYNGDKNKSKLEIVENTAAFKHGYLNYDTDTPEYIDINCVMIGNDRLVSFENTFNTLSGVEINRIDFRASGDEIAEIYGFDGYKDGTVHMNAYYDFNNDGQWSADEKFGSLEKYIAARPRAVKALEIAQAAIQNAKNNPENYAEIYGYNLADYQTDILIIQKYIENTYSYNNNDIDGSGLNARCNGGAEVLKVWSAYKYHVYGFVDAAPGAADHVEFYPGIDGVKKGVIDNEKTHYGAQGHH